MTNPLQAGVDHAELRRLAEAATPGPWFAADWDDDFGENRWTVERREPEVVSPGQSSIWPDGIRCNRVAQTDDGERPNEDAAYIAAANPAAMVALLNEIDALRAAPVLPDRGWRPIESAPRDGTWILLSGGATDEGSGIYEVRAAIESPTLGGVYPAPKSKAEQRAVSAFWLTDDCGDGYWATGFWDGYWRTSYSAPTHWMPLPDAPAEGGE